MKWIRFAIPLLLLLCFINCKDSERWKIHLLTENRPNGYDISIYREAGDSSFLVQLKRGDSITIDCRVYKLPKDLKQYAASSGHHEVEMDIPVIQTDTLNETRNIFFMDVNFDGEEELIIRHEEYNRFYYECFDLTKRNRVSQSDLPLQSLNQPPYNNLVYADYENGVEAYTVFDHQNKKIYIYETFGSNGHNETWAAYQEETGQVEVVKWTENEIVWDEKSNDWVRQIKVYETKNDVLQLSKVIKENL